MPLIPMVIQKSMDGERCYDIYSKLLEDRIILLTGEINDTTANIWIAELLYLESVSNDDIYIYINSPGGSIVAGLALYDTMKFIKPKIHTICIGLAASMAAFILSSGDKRYALKNSEVMIHQPLGQTSGQATDILIAAKHIEKTKYKLASILAHHTNQNISKILTDCERDYFLSSSEAVEYGIIDEILLKNAN